MTGMKIYMVVWGLFTWVCALTMFIAFNSVKGASLWDHFALGWTFGAMIVLIPMWVWYCAFRKQ